MHHPSIKKSLIYSINISRLQEINGISSTHDDNAQSRQLFEQYLQYYPLSGFTEIRSTMESSRYFKWSSL